MSIDGGLCPDPACPATALLLRTVALDHRICSMLHVLEFDPQYRAGLPTRDMAEPIPRPVWSSWSFFVTDVARLGAALEAFLLLHHSLPMPAWTEDTLRPYGALADKLRGMLQVNTCLPLDGPPTFQ